MFNVVSRMFQLMHSSAFNKCNSERERKKNKNSFSSFPAFFSQVNNLHLTKIEEWSDEIV